MGRYDLALIGFGGVNRALAELISQSGDRLAEELGFALRVVAITNLRAGSPADTDGIDLASLLAAEPGELSFAGLPGGSADPRNEWVIREVPVPAGIVVEATFTERYCLELGLASSADHHHDRRAPAGRRRSSWRQLWAKNP